MIYVYHYHATTPKMSIDGIAKMTTEVISMDAYHTLKVLIAKGECGIDDLVIESLSLLKIETYDD